MAPKHSIVILFLLTFSAISPHQHLWGKAPEKLELLHANELQNEQRNGKNVQILSGDIKFRRGEYVMYCDDAVRYEATDISIFTGHVRVYGQQDSLWADSLIVHNKRDLLEAFGHPELHSENRVIRARKLRYDMQNKVAEATGNVEMEEPGRFVDADSVWYGESSREAKIFGQKRFATVIDESRNVKIQGPLILQNLDTEYLQAEQRPVLVKLDSLNNEVVRISSNTIQGYPDSGRYTADEDVIITRENMRAETQRAVYFEEEDYARLEKSPKVWYKENTITGKQIEVYFQGNKLEQAFIPEKAEVNSMVHGFQKGKKSNIPDSLQVVPPGQPPLPDSSRFTWQRVKYQDNLKGSRLRIWFKQGNINRIRISGMAQSTYHVFEDSILQGVNETSGDTIKMQFAADSLNQIDVIGGTRGTFKPARYNASADTTIFYEADHIKFLVPERITYLRYNADASYKEMELTAAFIDVYWNKNLLVATPLPDSAAEENQDRNMPTFKQKGNEPMVGRKLEYNLKTKRGRVVHGETEFQDGKYVGNRIMKEGDKTLYVHSGQYTTCELPHPHYYFASNKMKLILKDKVIARPIILYIHGVPVFGLPFAVFPQRGGRRASGYIMPSFGENARDGRYLKGMGYFWAPNDYWDYRILFDFWDERGIALRNRIRYKKRYKFNGNIGFTYDKAIFRANKSQRYEIRVNHSQEINPTMSLRVNGSYVSSREFYKQTSLDLRDRLNQQIVSNATLNKRWEGTKNSMSVNLSRTENLQNGNVTETIPQISFRRGTDQIFKPPAGANYKIKNRWYYNLNYSYNSSLRNSHTHTFVQDSIYTDSYQRRIDLGQDSTFVDEYRRSIQHSVSIQSPITALKFLHLNPSLSFSEDWVPAYREPVVVNDTVQVDSSGNVRFRKINQFRARHTFQFSTSANTKLYGLFTIPFGPIQAIRHVLTPSVSYNIGPDFSKRWYGYYFYGTMPDGSIRKFDRFRGTQAGGTGSSETQSMRFSLQNLFQAKYLSRENGAPKENKIDFLTWNISTGYNFVSKTKKWSTINSSMRASLGKQLSLTVNMTHDPYKYNSDQLTTPRLTHIDFSTGFNLAGKRFTRAGEKTAAPDTTALSSADTTFSDSLNAPSDFGESLFASPAGRFGQGNDLWTLRMNLRYAVDKSNPNIPANPTFWLNTNGKLNISKNWSISMNARFDLQKRDVVSSSISIHRDLHCWELSFQWEPTGYTRGYYLKINVKSPNLQDLKIESKGGRFNRYGY